MCYQSIYDSFVEYDKTALKSTAIYSLILELFEFNCYMTIAAQETFKKCFMKQLKNSRQQSYPPFDTFMKEIDSSSSKSDALT